MDDRALTISSFGDRAWWITFINWSESYGKPGPTWDVVADCAGAVLAPVFKRDEVTYLKMTAIEIAAADRPLREIHGPPWLIDEEWVGDAVPRCSLVPVWVLPRSFSGLAAGRDWTAMRLREFQIALELKLYRGQHGSYPASLEELEKAIGHPLPRDPFSGKQFAYQRKGDGFTLSPTGVDALPQRTRETLKDRRMIWEERGDDHGERGADDAGDARPGRGAAAGRGLRAGHAAVG